jgi:type I restriction enzyme S subunit
MKNGWETKTLGDVLEVQNGYAFDSKAFDSSKGMPLIRIRSLKAGMETETRFSGVYDKKYIVKAGDLLIGMDGEFGCYEWKGSPALLNQRVCRLQGFASNIVPRFLFYGVNSHLKAIEDVTGYATVKHLSSKQILGIKFPLPPLHEQHRIVGILDEAFEGIATAKANAGKNLQNARALFESHLQYVFAQRGPGWVEKPLGEVCEVKDGTHDSPKYVTGGIPFVTQKNIREDGLSFEKTKFISQEDHQDFYRRSNAAHGDILISMIGANRGMACIVDDGRTFSIKNVGLVKQNQSINLQFLLYFLKSPQAAGYVQDVSKGGAQEFVGLTELRRFPVPLPPLKDQIALADKFQSLRTETQRLEYVYEQKLSALEALKKSLLHQAFTGKL